MPRSNILHVTDTTFRDEVLASDVPVVVDFWAEWCGPCHSIAPHLDRLADRYEGKAKIVKVDIDQNPATPTTYHVRGIPTLLVFKGGEVVDQMVGNPGSLRPLDDLVARNL